MAMVLAFAASGAGMVTWFHAFGLLLDSAAGHAMGERRRSRWLLVVLAAGVLIAMVVCMVVGTEIIGGPDRPMTCTTDELGVCRPTVDRSGPATPQAVHAIYVATAIALIGPAVLLVCSRLHPSSLAPGDTPHLGPDTHSGSPTTLLDHTDRNTSHG